MSEPAAAEAPAPVDALQAAAADRQKAWKVKDKPEAKGQAPIAAQVRPDAPPADAPKGTPDKAKAPAVAPVSDAKAPAADKEASASPAPETTPDLSWLPDKFRSEDGRKSPEFLEFMKGNVLRRSDYTKGKMEVAEERKAIEKIKGSAERWDTLVEKRPDIADIANRLWQGETLADIAATLDTNAEFSEIDKRIETTAERIVREKLEAQRQTGLEKESVGQVIADFASDEGLDVPTTMAVIELAKAQAADLQMTFTPKNVVALLRPHLDAVRRNGKASETNKATAQNGTAGLARVASPLGSGAGSSAPPHTPTFLAEGQKWPKDGDQRVLMAEWLMKQRRARP